MRHWALADGQVNKFEIVHDRSLKARATIEYIYFFEGKTYTGKRITVSDAMLASGLLLAQKLAKQFPVGRQVPVYFDRQNPNQCVLKRPGFGFPLAIFWSESFVRLRYGF